MSSGANNNWDPDDKLERKRSADFLTNYLTGRYVAMRNKGQRDTFVLNVRAGWGYGKTFFLKKWIKDLEQSNFPVVYFDAWVNDFSDDPLIGFIDAINEGLSAFFEKKDLSSATFNDAISLGKRLIKPIGITLASILVKQASGMSLAAISESAGAASGSVDSSEEVSSLISKCADIALSEHKGKRETIDKFKSRLEDLVDELEAATGVELPIFIFIDELDRCRPTYAIELLEAIKHLFGVPGVYFVSATNIEQLGCSVKVVYGSDFDSEVYLKRFFDSEYSLPSPDKLNFSVVLFDKYGLGGYRKYYPLIDAGINGCAGDNVYIYTFCRVCDEFNLSLRDREVVASSLFAVLSSFSEHDDVHLFYLICLIVIQYRSSDIYQSVSANSLGASAEMAKFKALFWGGISFKSIRLGGVEEVKLIDAFLLYDRVKSMSLRELNNFDANGARWAERLLERISQNPNGQDRLKDYESRVRHAGQLV